MLAGRAIVNDCSSFQWMVELVFFHGFGLREFSEIQQLSGLGGGASDFFWFWILGSFRPSHPDGSGLLRPRPMTAPPAKSPGWTGLQNPRPDGGGIASNAQKIVADSCCNSAGSRQTLAVCKIASLFQGMVNPQVNLFQ